MCPLKMAGEGEDVQEAHRSWDETVSQAATIESSWAAKESGIMVLCRSFAECDLGVCFVNIWVHGMQ